MMPVSVQTPCRPAPRYSGQSSAATVAGAAMQRSAAASTTCRPCRRRAEREARPVAPGAAGPNAATPSCTGEVEDESCGIPQA